MRVSSLALVGVCAVTLPVCSPCFSLGAEPPAPDSQTTVAAARKSRGPKDPGAKARRDDEPTTASAQALARLAQLAVIRRDVAYKIVGERKLLLDLYAPKGKGAGPYPTVVFIHGGGWRSGTKDTLFADRFMGVVEPLPASGGAVVSIDYRLSGDGALAKDMVADCKDALRYLSKNAKECGVDIARLGVWGPSAGGHLALMVGLTRDNQFVGDPALASYPVKVRFIDSWYGPSDMRTMGSESRVGAEGFTRLVGTSGPDAAERLAEISPITYLDKSAPPMLLCQGERDTTVPPAQSQTLYDKAREMGLDATLMLVRNAAHNFRATDEMSPSLEEIQARNVEFIRKHLGLPGESNPASRAAEAKP
ncbi:MAG: alpha/beta hydrolase [Candidatus Sumerlaeota bacterium]|nr:alpha/beta hydrolase [Candidatus Sumerlaeota bacterium]